MKRQLLEKGSRLFFRALLLAKKYSPELLVGAGIVGGAATVVLASKATLEVKKATTKDRTRVINLKVRRSKKTTDEYSTLSYQKDLTTAYFNYGVTIARLYWKPAVVGLASTGCVLTGTGILRGRNTALMAAYATLDTAYREYRESVEREYGSDRELELAHNAQLEACMEVDEDGNKIESSQFRTIDGVTYSPYAAFFDEMNSNWRSDSNANLFFLLSQQKYANDVLRLKGHVFLNEIYDALGIPLTPAGQIVGWLYENARGDGYIDFGINRTDSAQAIKFVNGDEPAILLDFNVDGPIYREI